MPTAKELSTQAIELLERAKKSKSETEAKAKAENRAVTAEERQAYTAQLAEYEAMLPQVEEARRFEAGDEWANQSRGRKTDPSQNNEQRAPADSTRPAITDEEMGRGIRAWALSRSKPSLVDEKDFAVAKRIGFHPGDNEITLRIGSDDDTLQRRQRLYRTLSPNRAFEEARALSTQVGANGGFTIAPLFQANVESALLYYGPMLQVCEVIRTPTGADLPFITGNETAKTGSYIGENAAITTAEDVDFAVTTLKVYTGTTNAILVPNALFRDSGINLSQYISNQLGERLGRFLNTEATTGAVKAKGLMTKTTLGVTAAAQTAITYDEILGLIHSVDIAYRAGSAFMFNDAVALHLRKLKDGDGAYLWSNGTQAGQPDRLAGFPVFINNDMAGLTTGNKTVAFGNFTHHKIRMVQDIRLTQTDQRYWEYDQMAFAAYVDFDSNLIDAGTHPVKHLVQA